MELGTRVAVKLEGSDEVHIGIIEGQAVRNEHVEYDVRFGPWEVVWCVPVNLLPVSQDDAYDQLVQASWAGLALA